MTATSLELPPGVARTAATATQCASFSLRSLDEASAPCADADASLLAGWVRTFLMRPHPDLGRAGPVCPFTSQAAKLSLVKIGISPATEAVQVRLAMRAALAAFAAMPCSREARVFRTVIVGFPNCAGQDGIATLRAVQNALRHHSVIRAKMIGLFEPSSEAEGLINRAFRPLRAPVPALAIRMLVEQDAPFVLRNPLLAPIYLATFPLSGPRRLWRARRPALGSRT